MDRNLKPIGTLCVLFTCMASARGMTLYGIHWDTGALYTINTSNAATAKVGDTRITHMGDIGLGQDGFLYGFSTGLTPALYKIDPSNAATTKLGDLRLEANEFLYEGSLWFTGNGQEALVSTILSGNRRSMFTIDFASKTAKNRVELNGDPTDINGWTDPDCGCGALTGLDRESNSFVEIDDATGAVTKKKKITPALGETGGMTTVGFSTFFVTGGPGGSIPGSNSLYRFVDSNTDPELIGALAGIDGKGFSGIAAPEPGSAAVLLLGLAGAGLKRLRSRGKENEG